MMFDSRSVYQVQNAIVNIYIHTIKELEVLYTKNMYGKHANRYNNCVLTYMYQ